MKQRNILIGIGSLIAIVVVVLGFANSGAINRQLHDWKVLPEPERLTELYFTNHTKLPTTYVPGESQSVSFTVHNLEYKTMTYQYSIQQISEDGKTAQPLANGTITLDQNKFSRQTIPVTLTDLNRNQVTVTLSPTNESIHYWINRG